MLLNEGCSSSAIVPGVTRTDKDWSNPANRGSLSVRVTPGTAEP